MSQKIGERELALRKQREEKVTQLSRAEVAAMLPKTFGVKPVKRKTKWRKR